MIDDAQMGMGIILIWLHNLCTCATNCRLRSYGPWELCMWPNTIHCLSFFFPSALLKENLPEHILLFVERVIILHIVVVGLVKHAIRVVVAVRVLIPYSSYLTKLYVRIRILVWIFTLQGRWHIGVISRLSRSTLLREILTS